MPLLLAALCACGQPAPTVPDRAPGERAPLSAACDPIDPARCALPWPSNALTVRDESSGTGLRLALGRAALPSQDWVGYLNLADGFSRLTPVMTAFSGTLAPESVGSGEDAAVRLLVAQPGAPDEGAQVPLRLKVIPSTSERNGDESLIIAYPLRPLSANADHVVVVLDSLRSADGASFEADALTRISLGLAEPQNDEDRRRAAYHAPTRALLSRAGIDPARVLRVWDFTTRSVDNARSRLEAMSAQARAAVAGRAVDVVLDTVTVPGTPEIAAIVEGRLTQLPSFRTEDGILSLDEAGAPLATGAHDAPFRVVIPNGTGAYRVVLYGHGTGGNVHDDAFDARIAGAGLGKVAGLFYGWDDAEVVQTLLGLEHVQRGVARSSAGLMQSLADLSAIEIALDGVLGDALSAPTLKDVANPAAGRRPDAAEPIWTGGSLGGTLGFVFSGLSPRIRYAVLNVAGAGWTHFVTGSELFKLIGPSLQANYASPLDFWMTVMASQLAWDDIDGGNWADEMAQEGAVYLVQQSMGDPILPNEGTEMCAATVRAVHVGAVLSKVSGLREADSADNQSALTQFKVPDDVSGLNRHGFANRSGSAGEAAREQISAFLTSALAGHPRVQIPTLCQSNVVPGSCDFSGN